MRDTDALLRSPYAVRDSGLRRFVFAIFPNRQGLISTID